MPLDTSLEATPVTAGKLDEIAPDLPVGAWIGPIRARNRVNDANYHQLILEWTAEESQTDDDNGVGGSTAEFFTFSPNAMKMAKTRIKEICDAYEIEVPDGSSLEEGRIEGLEAFIEALEAEKRPFWTTHNVRKDTGEVRIRIHCTAPRTKLEPVTEEEEEEKPKAKGKAAAKAPAKKAPAKKR